MPYIEMGDTAIIWDKLPEAYQRSTIVSPSLNGDELGIGLPNFVRKTINKASGKSGPKIAAGAQINVAKSAKGLAKGVAIGATAIAFIVPPVGVAVAGAAAAADKLIATGKSAKQVIDNTRKAAREGVAGAQRGMKVLDSVAKLRAQKGLKPGVRMKLTPAGVAAELAFQAQARANNTVRKALSTNPQARAEAKRVYEATRKAAAAGNMKAQRDLGALALAAAEQKRAAVRVYILNHQGRIRRQG